MSHFLRHHLGSAVLGALFLLVLGSACTSLLGDDFVIGEAAVLSTGGGAVAEGGGGATACTPNTQLCADAATLLECDANGQQTTVPCADPEPVCEDGACVGCAAGSTRCKGGGAIEACKSGAWQLEKDCVIGCQDEAECLTPIDIGAGVAHTCAVLSDGTVRCWGYNDFALLFTDSLDDPPVAGTFISKPTAVPALNDALEVDGGDAHSCALTTGQALKCWGWNGLGQLGDGTFANATEPVLPPLPANVVDFAVGVGHNCVAIDNGNVACWGLNESGQIGNGEASSTGFVTSPFELSIGFPAAEVSTYSDHNCVLLTAAAAACWGDNNSGELGNGTTDDSLTPVEVLGEGVVEITAGGRHSCGRVGQKLYCWGSNSSGQLGLGASSSAPVVDPQEVPNVGAVKRIVLGNRHSCAIGPNDELLCWGANNYGQIGNGESGTSINVPAPFTVPIGTVTDVALGHLHSCALTTDARVYCWGINNQGQLGSGNTEMKSEPQEVNW